MTDYLERFEELSHGVLLYNDKYDDTYFVTRCLGGLTEEIRSAIALHRLADVQEASTLALLQEEELDRVKKTSAVKDFSKPAYRSGNVSDKV